MELNRKTVRSILLIVFAAVVFYAAVTNLGAVWGAVRWVLRVFMPVLIGFAVYFITEPFAGFFEERFLKENKKLKLKGMKPRAARLFSVGVVLVIVLAILALIIVIIAPQIRSAIRTLRDTLPTMIENGIVWVDETARGLGIELELQSFGGIDWPKVMEWVQSFLPADSGSIFGGLFGTVSSVLSTLFDIIIGVVIGVKIVIDKENVKAFFRKVIRVFTKEETAERIFNFVNLCSSAFKSFISGQLLEACALAVMCCAGMLIFRFPYAVGTSAVMGITALIPVFGAWIGAIVGALLALTESPLRAVLFIVFIVILQTLDNTFVYPRIVGNSMRLSGLLVLTSVTVGGAMFGVVGMLLSVPAASVMYTLINRAYERRKAKKAAAAEPEKPAVTEPEAAN